MVCSRFKNLSFYNINSFILQVDKDVSVSAMSNFRSEPNLVHPSTPRPELDARRPRMFHAASAKKFLGKETGEFLACLLFLSYNIHKQIND